MADLQIRMKCTDTLKLDCPETKASSVGIQSGDDMRITHWLGALFIVAWLVLWLALKVTVVAIHALVVIGVVLIVVGLIGGRSTTST
jgi:Flp pilus assembly protein TadB